MRRLTAASVFAATLIAAQAHATQPLTYAFAIRVTQQDGADFCPPPGKLLYMRLTVDRSYPPSLPKNHTATYKGSTNPPQTSPILSVSYNKDGSDASDPIDAVITVQKDNAGVSGFEFDGDRFSSGFRLKFFTTKTDIVHTYRLPSSLFPQSFETATFEYDTSKSGVCYGNVVAR